MTLYMHLVTLVLASTAGAACFVAVWAAESRRHWFWRALMVWLCVATMLPIRAYEPALVFSISLPITALAIRAITWTGERRISTAGGAIDQLSTFRFGLRDALLAMALLGLWLAVAMHVIHRMALQSDWFRAKTLSEILLPAAAMTIVACIAWYVVRGRHRRVGLLCLAAAIGGFAWALWPRTRWLYALEQALDVSYPMNIGDDAAHFGLVTTLIGLGEFAVILSVLIFSWLVTLPWNRLRHSIHYVTLLALGAGISTVYWQMLWLTSFPPPLKCFPNHFDRICEIAERVKAINESSLSSDDLEENDSGAAQELQVLFDELLPLLESPSALTADLSSHEVQQIRERAGVDWIQTQRTVGRMLVAESKAAAAYGDPARAAEFAIASIQLGTAYCRNGLLIDDLLGRATMAGGFRELCSSRGDIDVRTAQRVIAALHPLDTAWESTPIVIQRDMAYCERVYGWQCRLSNIIERVTDGEPIVWKSFAPLVTNRGTWSAVNRMLQVDLAIHVFKHEHGRLPESLLELAPSILPSGYLDPFTGETFIYRPSADGQFLLYSVGKDSQDNGGKFTDFPTYHRDEGYDLDIETLKRR